MLARPPGRTPFFPAVRCSLVLPACGVTLWWRACRCCDRNPMIDARINLARARARMGASVGMSKGKKKRRTKEKKKRAQRAKGTKRRKKKKQKRWGGNGGNGGAPGALVLAETRPGQPSCWLLGRSPAVSSTAPAGSGDGADSPRRDAGARRYTVLRWTHDAGRGPALPVLAYPCAAAWVWWPWRGRRYVRTRGSWTAAIAAPPFACCLVPVRTGRPRWAFMVRHIRGPPT